MIDFCGQLSKSINLYSLFDSDFPGALLQYQNCCAMEEAAACLKFAEIIIIQYP